MVPASARSVSVRDSAYSMRSALVATVNPCSYTSDNRSEMRLPNATTWPDVPATADDPISRTELALAPSFKRCVEERGRTFYYFVSDSGVAYRFSRDSDRVETVIYQPSRVEVRALAVNTECVF